MFNILHLHACVVFVHGVTCSTSMQHVCVHVCGCTCTCIHVHYVTVKHKIVYRILMYVSAFVHTNIVKDTITLWTRLTASSALAALPVCVDYNKTFLGEQPTPSLVELFTLTDDVISSPNIWCTLYFNGWQVTRLFSFVPFEVQWLE